jgi:phosphate transport system substrate-binding protein
MEAKGDGLKRVLLVWLALCMAGVTAFANGNSEGAQAGFKGNWKFGGSITVDPIARAAIEAFAKKYPAAKLSYDSQGSGVGITGVLNGVYSLGGSSRELTKDEKAKGLVENVIALDGLAVIVNKDVPLADLSRKQIADIFNGTIKTWKDVGGSDKPIVVVTRDEASGSRVAFTELVLQKEYNSKDPKADFLKEAITVESNGDMVSRVGATPDTIGYCGEGFLEQALSAGAKPISVNGIAASEATVLNKTYPISRYLYLVSKGALKEGTLEKTFFDFVLSPEGQGIVKQEGFIAVPAK